MTVIPVVPGPKANSIASTTTTSGAFPLHDDRKLFEMLILEGAQAGLSWETILNKRENYRKAFDHSMPAHRRLR